MDAIIHTEINTTAFDMASGSYSVEKIEGDMVCSTCGCYVDELDEDVYYCSKCEKAS